MRQLVATGQRPYAYVGVTTEDLTPSLAQHFGYPVAARASSRRRQADSPAAAAGLRAGTTARPFYGRRVRARRRRDRRDRRRAGPQRRGRRRGSSRSAARPGEIAHFTVVRGGAPAACRRPPRRAAGRPTRGSSANAAVRSTRSLLSDPRSCVYGKHVALTAPTATVQRSERDGARPVTADDSGEGRSTSRSAGSP